MEDGSGFGGWGIGRGLCGEPEEVEGIEAVVAGAAAGERGGEGGFEEAADVSCLAGIAAGGSEPALGGGGCFGADSAIGEVEGEAGGAGHVHHEFTGAGEGGGEFC